MIICPNCGKENQDHYKFCLGCGSDLPKGEPAAPKKESQPAPAQAAAPAPTVEAPKRGASVPPKEAKQAPAAPAAAPAEAPRGTAAPAAGRPVEQRSSKPSQPPQAAPGGGGGQACPNCGSPIPEGFAFCGKCGHRIMGVPAAKPVSMAPAPAKLVFIQPDGSPGGSMPLQLGENKIGRESGGFMENDPFLSPVHAIFTVAKDSVTIKDAGSLNGIYLRLPPNTPAEIQNGDVIRLGQELVLLEMLDKVQPAPDGTEIMGSPIEGLWGRLSLVVGQGRTENAFPIGGDGVTLGRERGDIIFPEDGYVSGSHLRIQKHGLRIEMIDLQSSNGTFLRVRDTVKLEKGAYFLMGQQLFQINY